MGTLFECLKEARLERYYPAFRAQGVTRSESLTQLTIHDCPAFGITSAEDKRRLVDLINIVKAVHNTERDSYLPGPVPNRLVQNTKNKVPRKRNRSPAINSVSQASGRPLSAAIADVRVRDRSQANGLSVAGAFLGLLSDESSEETSSDSAEHSDYEPAVKHSVTTGASRELPIRVRKTPVEKVKHGAGYNYGVPGSSHGARPKTRASATRLNDDRIKVCVRKRPISKKEVKSGESDLVQAVSTTTLSLAEPKQAVDLTAYTLQHEFIFDEVFDETCTNEDVYIRAARPLINCIFDGGSATCFAYGQTGAGKTHTMIGNQDVPGLYLLASHDIFSIINSGQYGAGIKVWVSFFEIYCGQLFDLLNKRNRLNAREDGSQRVCIAGLTETEAKDEQNLMQVLDYGNAVRSKGSSGVNPDSSRSHAVLQMEIRDDEDKRLGRISFIDLAGSERAADSGEPDKQTRMEGAEINQSLLALKECIRSIDQESRHKPFRQSKLTHILKDSFMGNSRTCMIANVSPASGSCEHTLNTLRYADRVKELRKNTSVSTSRSMNVAMSNILMNIPASGPSLFQPSNILCSSTPMRQSTRQFTNRNASSDLRLDPSETPIRGPGVRRKTSSANVSRETKTQTPTARSSASASTRSSVVRHVVSNISPNVAPVAAPSAANSGKKNNVSSTSESDQTDTDSCNMTGQQKPVNFNQFQNVGSKPVNSRAVNRNVSGQNIPVVKSTDTENDFPTTDFNDEEGLNDLNRTSGKNPVTASVPVFPTGINKELAAQSSKKPDREAWGQPAEPQYATSSVSASVPVLRKKTYTVNQNNSKTSEEEDSASTAVTQQTEASSQVNKFSSKGAGLRLDTASAGRNGLQNISETKSAGSEYHREYEAVRQDTSPGGLPLLLTDSINDDMLFDPPSVDQRLWTPRTPSENSGTQPKFPQNPEIPAVLPAKSTELTTFSQRSPRWQLNKNPIQYNAPTQPQGGFRPEPVKNQTESSPNTRQLSGAADPNARNISGYHSGTAKQNKTVPDRNTQQLSYLKPKQRDNMTNIGSDRADNHETDPHSAVGERNVRTDESQGKESGEPFSATWFNTPVDHNTHVSRSFAQNKKGSSDKTNKDSPGNKSAVSQVESEKTGVKEIEEEYLPVQKNGNKSGRSDSGIVSDSPSGYSQGYPTSRTKKDQRSAVVSQGEYFSDSSVKSKTHSVQSALSRPRVVHSPVMDRLMSNQSPFSVENTRQKVVHSPVSLRQGGNTSPIIREYPSSSVASKDQSGSFTPASIDSQTNGRYNSTAVKTEKLKVGSMFSPIHPQPVTGSQQTRNSVAVSKDILHPTPVSKTSGPRDKQHPATGNYSTDEQIDLKTQLISSHEDQLATVTSLCKHEMKLLLGAKAGNKSFEEYMSRVSEVLSQKMSAIQLLQDQIIAYQLSTQDSNSP